MVLGLEKSKIKVPADRRSGEGPPGFQTTIYLYSYRAKRDWSLHSLIRALVPFMRTPLHDLINSRRPHSQIP